MDKKRKYQVLIISLIVVVVLTMIATAVYFANAKTEKQEKPDEALVEKAEQGSKAYNEGNYLKSLNLYLDFIHTAEQHPKVYGRYLVDAYFYLGIIYSYFNDFPNSRKYDFKAYETATPIKYNDHIVAIINNIIAGYGKMGDYAKVLEWNNKLLKFKNVDEESAMCHYYWNLGNIKQETLRGGSPISDYKKAYKKIENSDKYDGKSDILRYMASYYRIIGQEVLELEYLKKSFDMAVVGKKPQEQLLSARDILNYYVKKGNEKESMKYGKIYLSLLDSSLSVKKFIEAKNFQEQYEQNKANEKIQSMSITISKQRLLSYIIIATLLIALIIISIIVAQNKKLQSAYRMLYKKNIEVMGKDKSDGKKNAGKKTAKSTTENRANDSVSQPPDQLYAIILKVMEDPEIYCDPDFSLSKLAEMLGTNVTYVSKAINEHYGQNVRTFINSYRITEACRKISKNEYFDRLTLQAIAQSVGYSTQQNFNRAFKQITGMTPTVFQKMAKEAKDK